MIRLEDLKKGDFVVDGEGKERRVLGVLGNILFLSRNRSMFEAAGFWTVTELERQGYTVPQPLQKKQFCYHEKIINSLGMSGSVAASTHIKKGWQPREGEEVYIIDIDSGIIRKVKYTKTLKQISQESQIYPLTHLSHARNTLNQALCGLKELQEMAGL